ncbi:MAG: alpha-L-rhamnosidase-related protein [Ginsengibacter sp.]
MDRHLKNAIFLCLLVLMAPTCCNAQKPKPLFQNKEFALFADSVVQGKYTAKVLSPTLFTSDYQSPANLFKSNKIDFKFSINGKDNEMPSGTDNHFICNAQNGACATPVIKWGEQLKAEPTAKDNTYLPPGTRLTIRVDMSAVFDAFNRQGFYTAFNGNKIYKEDFKGVYVAGSTAPLTWDFDNLVNHPDLKLKDEGNHIFSSTLELNQTSDEKKTDSKWSLSKNIGDYPQYHSPYPVSDALYNMSLEEMVKAVEPDSTFRTGTEWAGVWTRDISYSIILSMAYMEPRVAMKSLLRKVSKKNTIIQDTGTGGAWPCSTDRMIWAVAAYEVYKATGNKEWLQKAYTIIKNSIDDDLHVAYDSKTGLVRGESSFLDWREETYPDWMQPADIFESECLGTNAVHYEANIVLSKMAIMMNDKEVAAKHAALARKIKAGINKYLWMPAKGYYAQYLYGRNYKIVSTRSETLGEALCVLWNIADGQQQKSIVSKMPFTDFGTTCIYPQIPNIPPYHNNAIWPFVQTYFVWAAAKAGNEKAVMQGIADIYRPAALFATNKENMVAQNGDFAGTQINSSNMLWSLSGNISLVHKVLFGLSFEEDGLHFRPFVPGALKGKRMLSNFKYQDAVLNITMTGFGNKIKSFMIDGKPSSLHVLPFNLSGAHDVQITLANNTINSNINSEPVKFSPSAPEVKLNNNILSWQGVKGAVNYSILKNGKTVVKQQKTTFLIGKDVAEYQVVANDKNGVPSFASEPLLFATPKNIWVYQAEGIAPKSDSSFQGFTGKGFVEISTVLNRKLSFIINVDKEGLYSLDFRYANGNGPVNTENKCAIRSLYIDNQEAGAVVFPQRGKNEWSNWGFSNNVKLHLEKGKHLINLDFRDFDDNMNLVVNQAMIDYLRLVKLDD